MANALSRLSNSFFGKRDEPNRPTSGMLGTGLASGAANGLLMEQYRTSIADAAANGDPYPSFEEWMMQRQTR